MRPFSRSIVLVCLSAGAILLGACGGGSSSSSYTIGGSVSGLTQLPGVVLEDNGGNSLTVSPTATTFTFKGAVSPGSAYNVTIETQPTDETCSVGSGMGTANTNVTSISITCTSLYAASTATNVVPISVAPGPADADDQTFNIPLVTVTVCQPGTTTCATIPDVLVDTGSSGLRLIASALPSGFTLPAMADPTTAGNDIFECMLFADGYSWGGVAMATVTVGGETTTPAAGIPVQIIDSSSSTTNIPGDCISAGTNTPVNTVDDFDANGVLGVGLLNQDCGSYCDETQYQDGWIYYSCSATSGCTSTSTPSALATQNQVANPVASFPQDNNGVIVQLPALGASGAPTASGYLVFGIDTETAGGTEADNSLNSATVLTADADGNFVTDFNGTELQYSFIDSGSNALYFPQPSPALATCGSSGEAALFYCPNDPTTLSAENEGTNGATASNSFEVANLDGIPDANFAINDVGGNVQPISGFGANGTSYFDWGLPFFYGRTVFYAIEGLQAEGTEGPYYAY